MSILYYRLKLSNLFNSFEAIHEQIGDKCYSFIVPTNKLTCLSAKYCVIKYDIINYVYNLNQRIRLNFLKSYALILKILINSRQNIKIACLRIKSSYYKIKRYIITKQIQKIQRREYINELFK